MITTNIRTNHYMIVNLIIDNSIFNEIKDDFLSASFSVFLALTNTGIKLGINTGLPVCKYRK